MSGIPRKLGREGGDLSAGGSVDPKGIIERAHDYLERSFLPGRTFTGPADFNAQLVAHHRDG